MIDGLRRFAINASGNQRNLISSPYGGRRVGVQASKRGYELRAFGDMNMAGSGFSGGQSVVGKNIMLGMLDEFLPNDPKIRNKIFRDIYYHDAVAGGAVDIYSTLPWSDFYLSGLKDRDALDIYHRSVESMRLKLLLPAISRDYMVLGVFIGTQIYDKDEGIFTAVLPQNIDFCELTPVPIYGMDPLIDLKVPDATKKLFGNTDQRIAGILQRLPAEMAESFRGGVVPLQPENTLYIPRRTLSSDTIGTSYYERILPIHLMEKALFRGSIDQAYRRQRSIMHITVGGDGDDYIPTQADMESQRDLWLAADQDPTGAIIVTRTGVTPNEVRNASDFWRVDEQFDFFSSAKYRALGINESFVTSEANYNTLDASMTIFIEGLRAYRSMMAQEIFYQKIFPAIAIANDFTRDKYQVLARQREQELTAYFNGTHYVTNGGETYEALCADLRHQLTFHGKSYRIEDLAIPHIVWQKHLRPEGDQTYFELLNSMQQAGIPIPLATMAMAGGLDVYTILNSADEDVRLRKQVEKYKERIAEFTQQQGGDEQEQETNARLIEAAAARFGVKRPKGLLNREYDDRLQPHYFDKAGRRKLTSAKGRQQLHAKINKNLAASMARVATQENRKLKREWEKRGNRRLLVHAKYGVVK